MLSKPKKRFAPNSVGKQVCQKTYAFHEDDRAAFKEWRQRVGLTQSLGFRRLLRNGAQWAAAWEFHERGHLDPVPELAEELDAILALELRLRLRLGRLGRRVADVTASDDDARRAFEEVLQREGRGGYRKAEKAPGRRTRA